MHLRFRNRKASVKPILNNKLKPINASIEIQKKYPSKFTPRLSNVKFPMVVFANNAYKLEWKINLTGY